MATRRDFLRTTAAALGALPVLPALDSLAATAAAPRTGAPLDLLVLGGTGFIGPHLVRHAVARGHRVAIFTRGRRQADLPASVERLVGDRNGQLGALQGRKWDAVVDDSATNPEWVAQSARLLAPNAGRYLFTSSTGVYYPYRRRGVDETTAPHLDIADPKDGSETYGVAKARCEREVMQAFGDRGVVVRPTYIVGPGDTSDRFPYWPVRLARGGEVLVPGRRDDPVQIIDVRDLAEFMMRLLEEERGGVYNVAGPRTTLTMPHFVEQARDALNAKATFVQVDDYAFLEKHGIVEAIPWALLAGNDDGMMSIRNDRAVGVGLQFRPLATTVRDTLAWWLTVPQARRDKPRFTITEEQERTALAEWKSR